MESIFQNWEAWTLMILSQVCVLGFSHYIVREKYLNYWINSLIGVLTWLLPLLVVSFVLGLDPRPIFLILAMATSMFVGVSLEIISGKRFVVSPVFHVLVVAGISIPAVFLIASISISPPTGEGWIPLLFVSAVSIVVCGTLTVFLHYSAAVSGRELYRKHGLTPGERRTISDALYVIQRKLQPRLGNVTAQMRRSVEQMQSGLASM